MTRIVFLSAFASLALTAGAAQAGCDPACKSGETCRYEAAGDKFYCEAKGVIGGGKIGTGTTLRPGNGVNTGNLPATTMVTPGN